MRTHLEYVRAAARDNEFVDAAEAIRLHMLLTEALESWDDLDDEQRAVLARRRALPRPHRRRGGRPPQPDRLRGRRGGRRGGAEQDQADRDGMNGLGAPAHVTTSSSRARLHAT